MLKVLLTDTHFGWKQNSITWLNSQIEFLDKHIIPFLKQHKNEEIRIIHLGDVFDSRSSISPMVAKVVREKFIEMKSYAKDFYIIAGNHDFYSPNSAEYDTLSMVFRDCGINLIIDNVVVDGDDMFVPWYQYKKDISGELKKHPEVKNIYTHADIFGEDFQLTSLYKDYALYKDYSIFSGHIHIPQIKQPLFNLGSCYPLNFADANHDRYAYVWDNTVLRPIKNDCSIKFWRIRDDEIFNDLYDKEDYYEFYIKQINMQNPRYQARISEITKNYKNICIFPILDDKLYESEQLEIYDIAEICKKSIPEHLTDKFNQVVQYINIS